MGEPDTGNLYVRFDEGSGAVGCRTGRPGLLYRFPASYSALIVNTAWTRGLTSAPWRAPSRSPRRSALVQMVLEGTLLETVAPSVRYAER